MKIIRLILLVIILNISFNNALAKTYYISSSSGKNCNSGESQSNPIKNISVINDKIIYPGDKILLKAGDTWNETLVIKNSGTNNNKIEISSYGIGSKPVIFGGLITNWNDWVVDSSSYENKKFYKYRNLTNKIPYGLWIIDREEFKNPFIFVGTNPELCKNENDFAYSEGYIWLMVDKIYENRQKIFFSYLDNGILLKNVHNIDVNNIRVLGTGYSGNRFNGGISVEGNKNIYSNNITISNCESSFNSYIGINAGYVKNLLVNSCVTKCNSRGGGVYVHSGSINVTMSNLYSSNNGKYLDDKGSDRGGISVGGSGEWHLNLKIENSYSEKNGMWGGGYRDAGIHLFKVKNAKITKCQSLNNGGPGIQINGEGDVIDGEASVIQDCIVKNNGMSSSSMYVGGILCFRPAEVINNIVYDNNTFSKNNMKYKFGGIFLSFTSNDKKKYRIINNKIQNNKNKNKIQNFSVNMDSTILYINNNILSNNNINE